MFLNDDIDGFMELVHDECVWEIMATGVFTRAAEVRELAQRSVAARKHTADLHMCFGDHVITEDHMYLEYVHQGIVYLQPAGIGEPPAAGSRF